MKRPPDQYDRWLSKAQKKQSRKARKALKAAAKLATPIPKPERKRVGKFVRNDPFYITKEWRELRYLALVKHGKACQCCGATPTPGHPLHVDHVKPRSRYPQLALSIHNVQVLCEDCNLGKGAWDETDHRPKPEIDLVTLVMNYDPLTAH